MKVVEEKGGVVVVEIEGKRVELNREEFLRVKTQIEIGDVVDFADKNGKEYVIQKKGNKLILYEV